MPGTDWHRVQWWFDEAVAREGEARAAFLARVAADAPTVAPLVRSLVEALDRDPDFLEFGGGPPLEALLPGAPDADGPDAPARLGRYRVERVLGEGGMGVVYLAVHDEGGFQRPVALKVARAALAAPALAERFVAERDILARLAHPNIAHLYDGGLTADGRPYLVMEYVDGAPITVYCAARALPVRERLALVRDVCRAVDAAHRQLVVHRDLKPSNILVTADGRVKLLDFGVAKVLDAGVGGDALPAPPTVVAFTPAYAAPEQLRRGRVTTATDVYGLGVVAYELVAGTRPHAFDGLTLGEMEERLAAGEPEPPVAAAARRTGGPARGGRLRRRTRPTDVDHVVLRALRADPLERYPTPGAFADDLERLLDGRPVHARTPTAGYRLRRFVQRHRAGVAAGALAGAALLAATGSAVQQARAATAQARRAEAERARSEAATARAQRINRFLQGVLATANPAWYVASAEKGPDVTVLRALELAAARMERELADDPETRADIHHTLGDTYRVLGHSAQMAWHLDRALALRRQIFRAPHPKLADGLYYAAVAQGHFGNWDAADSLTRAAVAMQRRRDEGNNLPYMLETLGGQREWRGDFRGAVPLYEESRAMARARFAPDNQHHGSVARNLASALAALGDRERAWRLAREVAARFPDAASFRLLAALTAADGDLRGADSLYRVADGLVPAGTQPAAELRPRLDRVADLLIPQGGWQEARAEVVAVRDALRTHRRAEPSAALDEARADALLAIVALGEGHVAEAGRAARGALALADSARDVTRVYDPYWSARLLARAALGRAYLAADRPADAAPLLRGTLRALDTLGIRGTTLARTVAGTASFPNAPLRSTRRPVGVLTWP